MGHCANKTATLHYITLHYTTLHYTKLHYTKLHHTTLHYTTLSYTTLSYTTLHYTTLHYATLHYTAHCTALSHNTTYSTPHCLRYGTLRSICRGSVVFLAIVSILVARQDSQQWPKLHPPLLFGKTMTREQRRQKNVRTLGMECLIAFTGYISKKTCSAQNHTAIQTNHCTSSRLPEPTTELALGCPNQPLN